MSQDTAHEPSNRVDPPSLNRSQTMRAMRMWMVEGSLANAHAALTGGNLQTAFALFLGCNSFQLGALSGIAPFVGLLQLVSSYFTQALRSRKLFATLWSWVSRALWLPILLIPFVLPRTAWVPAFFVLTLLSLSLLSIGSLPWQDLMADLVPTDKRGRYFGVRNVYATIVAIVLSIAGGVFLDHATKNLHLSQAYAFAIVFAVACVFTTLSFLLGRATPEPPAHIQERPNKGLREAVAAYAAPLKDQTFRGVIVFTLALVGVQAFTGPFFTAYQLEYMKMDYGTLTGLGAFGQVTAILAMPVCGYLADKYGNKPILILCTFMVLLIPFVWCLTTPVSGSSLSAIGGSAQILTSKLLVVVINSVAGFGWAGIGQTQFNVVMATAPRESRSIYISATAAIAGLVGGISPLIGGAIMQGLSHVAFPAHGFIRSDYHVLFSIAGVLRFGLLFAAYALVEPESRSAKYVLGQLKSANPVGTATALQRLSRSGEQETRERAAVELGRLKAPIAIEELVKALDDVALPVREKAAEALGEIGDSRAVDPLLSKLKDPGAGIMEGAAVALGKIGDPVALPSLVDAASQSENATSRRVAAIGGIGTLPHLEAADSLLQFVSDHDPAIRMAVIKAIGQRRDLADNLKISGCLLSQWNLEDNPVIIPLLAEALAKVGDVSLAPIVVRGLRRVESPVARRELLNSVGSIIGGSDSFYAYLALDHFAADDTITKILNNLRRRLKPMPSDPEASSMARAAVRVRQALSAYNQNNLQLCADRIYQATLLICGLQSPLLEPQASISGTIAYITSSPSSAAITNEEILLLVFCFRILCN